MVGTTSACAENTESESIINAATGNYLRVRGEYQPDGAFAQVTAELPPRARRIQHAGRWDQRGGGTTSACAENTKLSGLNGVMDRNYLRVRGEYRGMRLVLGLNMELPPRARRIHVDLDRGHLASGTTSACAENTNPKSRSRNPAWNYLRVRGEYR